MKKLEKRKRHLQRKLSKKYQIARGSKRNTEIKKGERFKKTNNIIKLEREIKLIDRKLKNIRDTYIHTITYRLASRVKTICIEDLNVSGMMKNRHLSKAIQNQEWRKFRTYLEYKCRGYGVKLIIADRFYPSTKQCSCCGSKKKFISLSERVYRCVHCGLEVDRDLNAAINLRNYALAQ